MYPLWLGIVALGGITAWWVVAVEAPPASDTPVAEVADAAMPTDAAPPVAEPSRLVWTIADRGPIAAGVLDACLARDGMPRALVVGGERTLITHPDRIRPIAVIPEGGGLRIDTPVEDDARLAAALVAPGGYLFLCSCSHAADLAQFRAACARGIGKAGRGRQVIYTGFAGPDHPQLPQLAESGYLKALGFRLD